jgi:putative transposase
MTITNGPYTCNMAHTYTQLYTHIVFAVKGRTNLISKYWRSNLYQYITGIVKNKSEKLMVIGGVSDHVHILLSTKPDCKMSDLVRDIKANSSRWINENMLVKGKFEWQRGFGAFSVCPANLNIIIAYIQNQEEHHKQTTFREEYLEFLETYQIEYAPEYIFEDIGDTTQDPS